MINYINKFLAKMQTAELFLFWSFAELRGIRICFAFISFNQSSSTFICGSNNQCFSLFVLTFKVRYTGFFYLERLLQGIQPFAMTR